MSAKCKAVPGTRNVCPLVLTCAACPALCPEALPVPSFSIAAQAPDGNAARILGVAWMVQVGWHVEKEKKTLATYARCLGPLFELISGLRSDASDMVPICRWGGRRRPVTALFSATRSSTQRRNIADRS